MKIVVDTNIVFSAILNSSSDIGKILINAIPNVKFYSCNFIKEELFLNRQKLQKLTRLDLSDLEELLSITTQNIHFINEKLLPSEAWNEAIRLTEDFDLKDAPFIALSLHLRATLWSGDKKLRLGVLKKGFVNINDTKSLLEKLSH